jgi:hypothetical protein
MMAALLILLFIAGVSAAVHILRVQQDGAAQERGKLFTISGDGEKAVLMLKYGRPQLGPKERKGFLRAWQLVRARSDRDPKLAITYADLLMSDLLGIANTLRSELAPRCNIADNSVSNKYQVAHEITKAGNAQILTYKELARAMDLYASLFDELLLRPDRERQ